MQCSWIEAERVDGVVARSPDERWHGIHRLPLDEQALSGLPPEQVVIGQRVDELL
jgi:hypothetical protein